jgi:hypothetical protein
MKTGPDWNSLLNRLQRDRRLQWGIIAAFSLAIVLMITLGLIPTIQALQLPTPTPTPFLAIGSNAIQPTASDATQPATTGTTPQPSSSPTPVCIQPTLNLGGAQYEIQNVARKADGSLDIPNQGSGKVYWVEGTSKPYVFVFSPSNDAASVLSSRQIGEGLNVTWADCSRVNFLVSKVDAGLQSTGNVLAQSSPGILIYVMQGANNPAITLHGAPPGAIQESTP